MLNMTKEDKNWVIKQCVTIGDWAVGCKTVEQLDTVDKFFNEIHEKSYGTNDVRVVYNLGITTGVILHKRHTLKKEQEKLASIKN